MGDQTEHDILRREFFSMLDCGDRVTLMTEDGIPVTDVRLRFGALDSRRNILLLGIHGEEGRGEQLDRLFAFQHGKLPSPEDRAFVVVRLDQGIEDPGLIILPTGERGWQGEAVELPPGRIEEFMALVA